MRLAIVGSRNCGMLEMDAVIKKIPADTTLIVSGGADGIDTLAEQSAKALGIPFRKFLPEYNKYGKSAPLQRNRVIVEHADTVIAFWDCASRGTATVIALCLEKRIPCEVVDIGDRPNKK